MQDLHADPLVERIMRDKPSRPQAIDPWSALLPEPDAEQGLTLDHVDGLLRQVAARVRSEERMRAESLTRTARSDGFDSGFRAGVETAVTELRKTLRVGVGGKVNAARGATTTLAGLIAEYVRPGEPFKDEWCGQLRELAEQVGWLCDEALDALESLQPVEPVDEAVAEFHDDHLSF